MKHPAKFTPAILAKLGELLPLDGLVLDPFAGTGLIHQLALSGRYTIGIEIEPEWAHMHRRTFVGDATQLPFRSGMVDAVATSCTYGNRFADKHKAKDGSTRRSYTHDLREATGDPERSLHQHNTGGMQWGEPYRVMHTLAWAEVFRVLRPGAMFLLNNKNHVRDFEVVPVNEWHQECCLNLGFELKTTHVVPVKGMGFGQNGKARVDHEIILQFRKPVTLSDMADELGVDLESL